MMEYESYKPSGIEWIGEIPSHWNCLRIKRLTNVKRGASPRPIDDPKYFDEDGEFAWVRIADVTASERYLEFTTQKLSELGASLSVKRFPGHFFLSIAGTVGKPVITKIKCCIHDGFVWFPNLKINPEYLYFIFSTGLPYQGLGKWGTQLNLNTDTVGEIFIPLPDETEIRNLVEYLDKQTTQIDKLIANKQKLIELLKAERLTIINEAVNGEGKNWEKRKLKYVAKLRSGEAITSDIIRPEGDYPVYGGNGLRGYTSKFTHEGDYVLIGRQGALCGNVNYANGKFFASEHAIVVSILDNSEFIWLGELMRSMNLNQYSLASAQPGLSVERIQNLSIPVPSKKEQIEIVNFIQTETQRIDNTISKIEQEIELMQEYRTALISEVVTGKLKV